MLFTSSSSMYSNVTTSTRINSSSVHMYIFVCSTLRVILQGFVDPIMQHSVQRLKYQEYVTKHIGDKLHTNCNTEWVVSLENPIGTLYKMDVMNSDVSACVCVNLTCKHYRLYLDHLHWMCCNL